MTNLKLIVFLLMFALTPLMSSAKVESAAEAAARAATGAAQNASKPASSASSINCTDPFAGCERGSSESSVQSGLGVKGVACEHCPNQTPGVARSQITQGIDENPAIYEPVNVVPDAPKTPVQNQNADGA